MRPTIAEAVVNGKKALKTPVYRWLVIGLAAGAFLATAAWSIAAGGPGKFPADTSPDAGFARDMIAHHEQAVNMSFIIRESSSDQDVRRLAYDIINTQSVQIGMMSGWLELWNLPQTSTTEALAWAGNEVKMDHSSIQNNGSMAHVAGMMPGMATPEQIEELKTLNGNEADKQYLKLMIAHHQGGIMMAEAGLKLAKEPDVKRLAQTIVNGQQAEIDAMRQMLKAKGE